MTYAFYAALAAVFVWACVAHRDKQTGGGEVDPTRGDGDEDHRGYTSVIRRRQRLLKRLEREDV
jgi:hypothetical protein